MKFINADKLHSKSGGVGHHSFQLSTLPLNQGLRWEESPEWRER